MFDSTGRRIAGRTRRIPIQVAALIVPLRDPIALAEDMAVLDIASGGRVSYVTAVGYRPEEYAMFGGDFRARGQRMEACLTAMRSAWAGESFEFEGRSVRLEERREVASHQGLKDRVAGSQGLPEGGLVAQVLAHGRVLGPGPREQEHQPRGS